MAARVATKDTKTEISGDNNKVTIQGATLWERLGYLGGGTLAGGALGWHAPAPRWARRKKKSPGTHAGPKA